VGDRRGFTLLEALVALVIVGLAMVPLMGSIGAGVREQGKLRGHLDAVSLAESRMSELALVPPDSIRDYAQPRHGWFPEPFAGYRWSAVLRSDGRSAALVRGAVVVRWKGGEYSLETVFHRTELLPEHAPAR
jgi:type II secretion system protein I